MQYSSHLACYHHVRYFLSSISTCQTKAFDKNVQYHEHVCARGVADAAKRLASTESSPSEKVLALKVSSILSSVFDECTVENISEEDLNTIGKQNVLF